MLRQQHRFFRNVLMACDLAIIIAAAVLAYSLRFHVLVDIIPPKESVTSFQVHAIPILVVWPLMWLAAISVGLYKPRRIRRAGQGIQSLQTALHAAGARTAICSLWKVDDAATRRLFEVFYTKLWKDGLGKADALWQAKMALRSEGHALRDWAGWVLTGEPG